MSYVPPYSPSLPDWQRMVSSALNPALSKVAEAKSLKSDYGAAMDGTSDDTAAWSKAFTAGGHIVVPEGVTVLDSIPTAPTGTVIVSGAGIGKSIIVVRHTGARALLFSPASVTDYVEVTGVTLIAAASGPCPIGIEIAFPSTASYPYAQVKVEAEFRSDLASVGPSWASTWGRGIRLTNAWYPDINVRGSSAPIAGDTGNTGFLEVTGGSYGMVGARIQATWYYGADFIRGSAYIEGIYIKDSEAVGVTRGVYVPSSTTAGGAAGTYRFQSLYIINTHMSAHTASYDLDTGLDFRVTGGNTQRWADASATNWTGYKLNGVLYPEIIGGTIAGNDASGGITSLGISATGANSAHGIVLGVHFENLDTQFNLAAATSHWTIRGNVSTGATADTYTLAGTGHDVEWLDSSGYVKRTVDRYGFFGATPVAKPTVTGAKGGNAALTSLLTQLASLGLITDSST